MKVTFHSFVAPPSPPRASWSKRSSVVSTKRQKLLQKVAIVRKKTYGSEKKAKPKEKSFLERRSVQVPVERDYRNRFLQFTTWSRQANMPTSTVADIDEALTLLMTESFFEGRPGTDGRKMLAALGYCVPILTRGSPELVRVREAAIGWKKLSPAHSRLPTPWPVVCMLINQLASMGHLEPAQAVALTFVLYLRPSESMGLTAACLAPHTIRACGDKQVVCHPPPGRSGGSLENGRVRLQSTRRQSGLPHSCPPS